MKRCTGNAGTTNNGTPCPIGNECTGGATCHTTLIATDKAQSCIRVWTSVDTAVNNTSQSYELGYCGQSAALLNKLNKPTQAKFDKWGNIWVSDTDSNRVVRFPRNTYYRMDADVLIGQSTWSGTATTNLNSPSGVTVLDNGNIAVSDTNNNRINIYPAAIATPLPTAISNATPLKVITASDCAPNLKDPTRLVNRGNNLVVTDTGNHRVLEMDLSTLTGTPVTTKRLGQPACIGREAGNSGFYLQQVVVELWLVRVLDPIKGELRLQEIKWECL
jgi:hypothetical protein